jgi:pimeloyl-ACP methyl ester carboxylesterase
MTNLLRFVVGFSKFFRKDDVSQLASRGARLSYLIRPRGGRPASLRLAGFPVAAGLLLLLNAPVRADPPLHSDVLVFVPAYEGSQLFDPDLNEDKDDPLCVWGNYNVFLSSKRYFALRMPNPLVAKPMMAVGPLDVYRGFVSALTETSDEDPTFQPYTRGADFFIFAYDWRQEIATVSAPQLGRALERYAEIHAARTGLPAQKTKFIVVTHSMGGLVARTLLSERPELASRISGLYLVGSPNDGSVKATRTVIVGPDSIDEYANGFPGALLNIIPTNVDQNVTKLVGITRPSLYELLPWGDPHWEEKTPEGALRKMTGADVLQASSWETYWPSAGLEKRLFLDGWLKERQAEGRKIIKIKDWEFCQNPDYTKLKNLLSETARWRSLMGPLSGTNRLMTRSDGTSRMRIILGTGLKTPTGVFSTGSHDTSAANYTYDPPIAGTGRWRKSGCSMT